VDHGVLTLSIAKDTATILGAVIAVFALLKGLFEYRRGAFLRRAEHFSKMKQSFLSDGATLRIAQLLETDDRALEKISARDKQAFLCFFEEVALLLRRKLIRPELAYYMFGYYAVRCNGSKCFWTTSFPKTGWSLFLHFASQMEALESAMAKDPTAFARKVRL